jgi:hypothetical protein
MEGVDEIDVDLFQMSVTIIEQCCQRYLVVPGAYKLNQVQKRTRQAACLFNESPVIGPVLRKGTGIHRSEEGEGIAEAREVGGVVEASKRCRPQREGCMSWMITET